MNPTPTLIADNSNTNIKIIKKALLENTIEGLYFEEDSIFTACDGMEAFEIMGNEKSIKLIISEMNMPNLNGNELIEILKDTNKIDNVDIFFTTTTVGKPSLNPSIKEHVVGVINKPFNVQNFNTKVKQSYTDKTEQTKKVQVIKNKHVKQKKEIYKIATTYLEHFSIELKSDVLNSLIDENFTDEEVPESEYKDIIYASLSVYMFEIESDHAVDNKRIACIIKSMSTKSKIRENRFQLIDRFKRTLETINDTELSPKEMLKELTIPTIESISMIFGRAKNYPKQDYSRFGDYFEFIKDEFAAIDCEFIDDYLMKLTFELKEITEFNKWIHDYIERDDLSNDVNDIKKAPVLYREVVKRLKYVFQRTFMLRQHYSGEIDQYIWKRAKSSKEISAYLKKNMPKTVPNSSEFLLHKGKITEDEYNINYKLDRQNIIVLSNKLEFLEVFKTITDTPFENWHFYAFANVNMLSGWLKSNTPHVIIIDYNFYTNIIKNGMQFLRISRKKSPAIREIIKNNKIYIVANDEDVVTMQNKRNFKDDINYTIINRELSVKDIKETLLYH